MIDIDIDIDNDVDVDVDVDIYIDVYVDVVFYDFHSGGQSNAFLYELRKKISA